jgi:hypothetical protein
VANPFRNPAAPATKKNADALVFYRHGQWEEARQRYRDALAADPQFLAPRLNIACSFVRQERFREAATEAADMGALKDRPEMALVQAALEKGVQRWTAGLGDDLLFVGRLRAPLRLPDGDAGVFILGPHQELFAWSPTTNRFRQLTTEDGRVLGFLSSTDRRHVLYLTAEKLVRKVGGDPAGVLRGVVVHRLDLASLTSAEPIALAGDITRVEVRPSPPAVFSLRIAGDQSGGTFSLPAAGGPAGLGPRLRARATGGDEWRDSLVLSPSGASGPKQLTLAGVCPLVARDGRSASAPPTVEIRSPNKKPFTLPAPFGASVSGLPLR